MFSRLNSLCMLVAKTKRSANRAAAAFRIAASCVAKSTTLGAFYRRIKARSGAPKAITATAASSQ